MKKLFLLLCLFALPALAAPDYNHGPAVGLLRIHLLDQSTGKASEDLINAGAGWQFTWGFFPKQFPILNQKMDLLVIGAVGLYERRTNGTYTGGAVAGLVGTASGMLSLGFGTDLWAKYYNGDASGLFTGNEGKQNLFLLVTMDLFRLYEVITGAPTLPADVLQMLQAVTGAPISPSSVPGAAPIEAPVVPKAPPPAPAATRRPVPVGD